MKKADQPYLLTGATSQVRKASRGANMALRHGVCHSLAHARLISRLMSPREEKDVKLLSVSIFTTNRGHSVLGKKNKTVEKENCNKDW